MTRNVKLLHAEMPTYFIEKQRKQRAMEQQAQIDQDHAGQMLAGLLLFGLILTVIVIVYCLQNGIW